MDVIQNSVHSLEFEMSLEFDKCNATVCHLKKTFKESYFYAPAWTAAGLTLGTIPAEREKMFIASWCDQLRLVPYLGACEKTNSSNSEA